MPEVTEGFLLSPQQQRLIRLGAAPFHVRAVVQISGEFEVAEFERSLNRTLRRYEVLSTSFRCAGALYLPLQIVGEPEKVTIATAPASEAVAFDPTRGSLLRVLWHAESPRLGRLTFIASALVADPHTLQSLVRDAIADYLRVDIPATEPSWRFVDVAQWHRDLIESPETAAARHHWRFFDPTMVARQALASQRVASADEYEADRFESDVPESLAAGVSGVAALLGVDERAVYLLAFLVHLQRLLDTQEIIVTVRCDGRTQDELQTVPGALDRLVPLRWTAPDALCTRDALHAVKNALAEAEEWQAYFALPFAMEEAQLRRAPFGFDYCKPVELPNGPTQQFDFLALDSCMEPHTLQLTVCARRDLPALLWCFDRRRLDHDYVQLLNGQYLSTLRAILAGLDTPLPAITFLSDAERPLVVRERCHPVAPAMLVHERFEQSARRSPEYPAIYLNDEIVTYGALDARAEQLAVGLRALGVSPDTPIGLAMEIGIEAIVALFAVLKAGGAFVPLDARAPRSRLEKMIDAARLQWVLASNDWRDSFAGLPVKCVAPDELRHLRHAGIKAAVPLFPDNLAYVMFTSGSTGVPKGVAISHGNVHRYVAALHARLQLPAQITMATPASLFADFAYTVLFGALCTGRAVRLVPPDAVHGADTLAQALAGSAFLKIVPSHFSALSDGGSLPPQLLNGILMFGGEALPRSLLERLRREAPHCRVINHYGPTETTIGVCVLDTNSSELRETHTIPIGTPLSHADVLILDGQMQPSPIGVPGDLYVRGSALARGYLYRADLTAQAFIPDPYSAEPGARMYRTGDRARRLFDGNIEFLGRGDRQVKIRGYRIELGEIERELTAQPGIAQALVRALADARGQLSLVAYFVSADSQLSAPMLHAALRARLPSYMLPVAYVRLDDFPRLSNGKLDLVSLPLPTARDHPRAGIASAPQTSAERIVREIWRELLETEEIGVTDNFFDAGGHSLLLIKLRGRLIQHFGRELAIVELFKHTTVRAQAAYMESAVTAASVAESASSRAAQRTQARGRRRKQRVEEHG